MYSSLGYAGSGNRIKKYRAVSYQPGIFNRDNPGIPVIFQVASLLAALTHPGHIVFYAPGDSLPCRRDPS
ncbi:hypothetical protein C6H68_01045 [Photorhabdus luminescens]|nr:hypothetical protein C6H68_01045 [Photorhabdus luminescens]